MGDPSLTQKLLVDPATNAIADRVENLVAALWDYSLGLLVNLVLLCRHAKELEEEMKRLCALKADLEILAKQQIRQNRQAEEKRRFSRWFGSVEALVFKASDFEKSFGDRSLCSIYLGHTAVRLLKEVKKLTQEGEALQSGGLLINQRGPDAVQPVPGATMLVGAAESLKRIKNYILDERIGIISVWGMGGVGKTALLKTIFNDFLMRSEYRRMFDVAIWVTVSRKAKDIPSIQKTIAERLELPSDPPVIKDTLFRELRKRRFVLFLDDVWEKLDLEEELGVPLPKNSNEVCKILLTTRSNQVCCEMDADKKVKVGFLDEDSSWELFRSKFGMNDGHHHVLDDDPVIKPLAKQVMAKCGGLPISLLTVGRAMAARARTEADWLDAKIKLDHSPADRSTGLGNYVLPSLRFSFDKLSSKTLKDCLLYFALFPDDRVIEEKQIIDYWICEGFLDSEEFDELDIEDTRRRGHTLITDLRNACLLEVDDEHKQYVSLHDTVRDMALWISKEEFVVLGGSNCNASQVPTLAIWQKATRISLIDNKQVEEPPSSCWNLNCPNLTTLLLNNSRLGYNVAHNQGFLTFTNMSALKVLDLSEVYLEELPIGITSLISLQFLSLRENYLTSLPVEFGNLVNLRQLDLSGNWNLEPIPREALSRLSSLQVLDMSNWNQDGLQRSELVDLETLKSLCELHLRGNAACSWELLQVIAESPALRRSIRELKLYSDDVSKEAEISIIHKGASPSFPKLRKLQILGCGWYDLTWIGRLLCLEQLVVKNCEELTEIILCDGDKDNTDDQTVGSFFLKLQRMELAFLPSLRSINTRTLLWPSLEELYVEKCPELRRLPWNGGLPCFPKLRKLQIRGCGWYELTWIGQLLCLEQLVVKNCDEVTEILLSDGNKDDTDDKIVGSFFPKLQRMELAFLPSLRSISTRTMFWPSLKILIVEGCPELRRLPWNGRLPCLQRLKVENCGELTEILSDENKNDTDDQTVGSFFPKLQKVELGNLPSLRSISTRTLLWPSLNALIVMECPQLRQLPLGRDSAPNIRVIVGSETWWDGLEWKEITILERFGSKFFRKW